MRIQTSLQALGLALVAGALPAASHSAAAADGLDHALRLADGCWLARAGTSSAGHDFRLLTPIYSMLHKIWTIGSDPDVGRSSRQCATGWYDRGL